MDAFDSDVLIYASVPGHLLGRRVAALFWSDPPFGSDPFSAEQRAGGSPVGVGSVLLAPEVLTKPKREGVEEEVQALAVLLSQLDLRPVDDETADLAVILGSAYRLRTVDAVHLATAVAAGADRFLTNNSRDFSPTIAEIDVVFPTDLPDPKGG